MSFLVLIDRWRQMGCVAGPTHSKSLNEGGGKYKDVCILDAHKKRWVFDTFYSKASDHLI